MHERHGHTVKGQPRLYRIWRGMKSRCSDSALDNYSRYGGRGISVCDEWVRSFPLFYEWAMANGYEDSLSIDRIDNNGNYTPENCRWATTMEQGANKRSACLVEINGRSMPISRWAQESGISFTTLYKRYKKGTRGPEFLNPPDQRMSRSARPQSAD